MRWTVRSNSGKRVAAKASLKGLRVPEARPGDVWKEPLIDIEFVWVPGGFYQMGCGSWAGPWCNDNEEPVHEACVDGFWMNRYEVTNEQYAGFLNDWGKRGSEDGLWIDTKDENPDSHIIGGVGGFKVECGYEDHPVIEVSWYGAKAFASWLSHKTHYKFRLPTEAEWEYTCRSGGKLEKYAGGYDVDLVAWYIVNSDGTTHPVGTKAPNGLGLYDMCGNVWEWCKDMYSDNAYSKHRHKNPLYGDDDSSRVVRGGGYGRGPGGQRCAYRLGWEPDARECNLGFRLVRTIEQ